MKKKTDELFKKEVYNLVKDEYEVIGEYTSSIKKICMKHSTCGKTFDILPNDFLRGRRCTKCSYKKSLTLNEKKVEALNLGYEILTEREDIKNLDTILVKHIKCGNIFETKFKYIFKENEKHCKCEIINFKNTKEDFVKRLEEKFPLQYTVNSNFIAMNKKINVTHTCGNNFDILPKNLIKSKEPICRKCSNIRLSNERRKTKEKLLEDFINADKDHEFNIINLDNYKNNKSKITVNHNLCNNSFNIRPMEFINQGNRCPFCNTSRNEKVIRDTLINLKINFEEQYNFPDLENKFLFDFYLRDLNLIIEYDGEWHYLPIISKERLKDQQNSDQKKNKICEEKQVNILRIPYWEKDHIIEYISKITLMKTIFSINYSQDLKSSTTIESIV